MNKQNDRDCEKCRHFGRVVKGDEIYRACTLWNCSFSPIVSTTRTDIIIDAIKGKINSEADYQDTYVNADIARGLYMAIEIIDKVRNEVVIAPEVES